MTVINLGLIDYKKALEKQIECLDKTYNTEEEFLIVCSHNRVITIGSAGDSKDIKNFDGEIVKVKRGGKLTLHGPGQILLYPILNLNLRNRDLRKHLKTLEEIGIEVLNSFNLKPYAKDTGVWVNQKKIISIGVGAKKWVTYHGMAFNITNDFFNCEFNPCGMDQSLMTSLEDVVSVDSKLNRSKIESLLINTAQDKFCL